MRASLLVACVMLAGGCTIPESEAPAQLANAWCKQKRHCDRGDYEAQWDSRSDCEADVEELVESFQDFYDLLDCEYDPREAGRARRDIRSASCEEFGKGDFGDPEIYDCD